MTPRPPGPAGRRGAGEPRVRRVADRPENVVTGCGYLHNAFGPGCPYCTLSRGNTGAQVLTAEAEPTQGGLTTLSRPPSPARGISAGLPGRPPGDPAS